MKKLIFGGLVFAAILVIVIIVIPPKEKHNLTISTPPLIASLPHWVAQEKGFYEQVGLEIKEYKITDSKLMIQTLYNDDIDALPAVSLVNVINDSKERALKPIIYSHSRMKNDPPFEALSVPRGSPISTLKDLEGKKIAVYPGITSRETVKYFLKINQVKTDSIEFIPIGPPEHIQLLQNGEVDCSHIYDPFKTANLEGGKTRLISQSLYGTMTNGSAIGVSVLSPKLLENDPQKAQLFLDVWDKAVQYIRDNPEEASKILANKLNLTMEVARKSVWVDVTKVSELDRSKILETIKVCQKIGLIDDSFNLTDDFFIK